MECSTRGATPQLEAQRRGSYLTHAEVKRIARERHCEIGHRTSPCHSPVFVIAFVVALVVGRAWVVLLAGLVIAFVAAVIAAMGARGEDNDSLIDFSPSDAFLTALVLGGYLYAGWALGAAVATLARFWAARRRGT
jgi:hypothetical protein